MNSNHQKIQVNFKTRLTLIISVIDSFTGEVPFNLKHVNVYLKEWPFKAVKKPDGHFVFTELTLDAATLVVESDIYEDVTKEFSISSLSKDIPMFTISLIPATNYLIADHVTRLRLKVTNEKEEPLMSIPIEAAMTDEESAIGRVGLMKNWDNLYSLPLISVVGKLAPGDSIRIQNKKTGDTSAHIIDSYHIVDRIVKLRTPLRESLPRGSVVLPVIKGQTDRRGEAIVFFRPFRKKECAIELTVGTDLHKLTKEVLLKEGTFYNFGAVQSDKF